MGPGQVGPEGRSKDFNELGAMQGSEPGMEVRGWA